jgi:hypothetical protein
MVRAIRAVRPVLALGLLAASCAAAGDEHRAALEITLRRVPLAATAVATERS